MQLKYFKNIFDVNSFNNMITAVRRTIVLSPVITSNTLY